MKKRSVFILMWLSFFSSFCHAQDMTVAGMIKDTTDKKIEGATVVLVSSVDSSNKQETISSKNGSFEFLGVNKGQYELRVTHVSFVKYLVRNIIIDEKSGQKLYLVVQMQPKGTGELKEVVITAQKAYTEQKIDRQVVNIDVRIANTGANVFEVLNNGPGVGIDESGEVSIRGKMGAKIFIDDKPVYLSSKDLVAYLKTLPSGTIDKIEIMSNPSAKYNAEGTAGIVNIITKRSKIIGFSGNITTAYSQGVYSKLNESMNLTYRTEKMSFLTNLSYSVLNNFLNSDRVRRYMFSNSVANDYQINQDNLEINKRNSRNFKIDWSYQVNKRTSLGINTTYYGGPYTEKSIYESRFMNSNNHLDSNMHVISNTSIKSKGNTINLNYNHQFSNSNSRLSLDLDFLKYKNVLQQLSESNTFLADGSFLGSYILSSDNPFLAKIYSTRADFTSQILNKIKIESGIQNMYSQRNNIGSYYNHNGNDYILNQQFSNTFTYQENIQAAYVNFSKENNRLAWQSGLRLENTISKGKISGRTNKPDSVFKLNYLNVFPTMYFSYKLDSLNKNLLIFSVGRRILRPSYRDLNPSIFFFDKYTYSAGNPILQPEYSSNFELTFSHLNKWALGIAYIISKNSITQVYQQNDSAFVSNNMNIDLVSNLGVNYNANFKISKRWSFDLFAQLNNTHYKGIIFANQQLNDSRTTLRLTGSSKFTFKQGLIAEIGGFYKNKVLLGQAILLPGWQIYLSFQKKVFKDKAVIGLTARDIAKSWVVKRDITIKNAKVSYSNRSDTRLINLSFTYKFGKAANSKPHKNAIESEQSRVGS